MSDYETGRCVLPHTQDPDRPRPARIDLDQLARDCDDLTRRYSEGQVRNAHGLLHQVADCAVRALGTAGQGEKVRTGKTGSRAPSGQSDAAVDLLALIEVEVFGLDADFRDHLDAHLDYERPWLTVLDGLPGLARRAGESNKTTLDLSAKLRRWRSQCRIALSYDVPMTTLDMACPYCKELSLKVRSDATSDVLCVTAGCQDERGDQPRWNRHTWVLLLTETA